MRKLSVYWSIALVFPIFAFLQTGTTWQLEAPMALFIIVLIAATLCAVAAGFLGYIARRNNQAELGFISAFYFAASIFPLVHGITLPGVLYSDNMVTMTSVFLSIPLGLVAMLPNLVPKTRLGRWAAQHWKGWTTSCYVLISLAGVWMLATPGLDVFPRPGSLEAWLSAMGLYILTLIAGSRHVWLARVAGKSGPLVIAFGYMLVGSSAFAFIDPSLWSPYFLSLIHI